MYLFRVPPSACSVGTYLASQSSHLNVFFCCCICRRVFLFFLQNSHVCSFHFAFVGQFLYESIMYEHVAVEHLLFQVLQQRKHYTAHHKRLTALNRKYVPMRERQRNQADRVEERVYCRAFIQHAEVSNRRSGNLHIPKTHTTAHTSLVLCSMFLL